ncbi:hypothetical protein AAFF_G00427430 [Aldrovandia affinis]|uniref:Uncharacterized protein n=1 Tax=Aldrovandia affinis TaxID=143900 RepID=A0AAD7WIW4_9TELE|nr:hypothetical protein AAFF_G00427430 [Aldrovandia affinis]
MPTERELKLRIQRHEDEDEDEDEDEGEEPETWTCMQRLLICLCLSLYLYLYHRALLLRTSLQRDLRMLGDLSAQLNVTVSATILLSQQLLAELVAPKNLVKAQLSEVTRMILELYPVSLALSLPRVAQQNLMMLMSDLQELSKILLQLLINTTPLYNMLVSRRGRAGVGRGALWRLLSESDTGASSVNGLSFKILEDRARRRRSLYGRFHRDSSSTTPTIVPSSAYANPANGARGA